MSRIAGARSPSPIRLGLAETPDSPPRQLSVHQRLGVMRISRPDGAVFELQSLTAFLIRKAATLLPPGLHMVDLDPIPPLVGRLAFRRPTTERLSSEASMDCFGRSLFAAYSATTPATIRQQPDSAISLQTVAPKKRLVKISVAERKSARKAQIAGHGDGQSHVETPRHCCHTAGISHR